MKKLISVFVVALALSSCATKTVSRTELFTPTTATLINSEELTGMMYYGADDQYDYFTRGWQRLRVAKTENAVPSYARFTFNHWQGGKKYTECLQQSTVSQLQSLLSGLSNAQPLPSATTTPATSTPTTTQQQRAQMIQSILQSALQR